MLTILARSVVAMATLAFFCQSARSQSMSISMGLTDPTPIFEPKTTQADFQRLASVLGLKGEEFNAASELYDGYVEGLRLRSAELVESQLLLLDRASMLRDVKVVQTGNDDQHKLESEWRAEAKKREASFLEDLKSLLATKDVSRWEIAQRELRRVKQRGKGLLLAESVDHIALVHDVAPQMLADTTLQEILNRYAEELDPLYVSRERAMRLYREAKKAAPADLGRMQITWDDMVRARIAVRDLNERYAPRIVTALGAQGGAYLDAFTRAAYPDLARSTVTSEIVAMAPQLADISAEQRRSAEILQREYESAVLDIARRSVPAAKVRELAFKPEWIQSTAVVTTDHMSVFAYDESSELGRLAAERAALDARTRQKILALFTPKQRAPLFADRRLNVIVNNMEDWRTRLWSYDE